MGVAEPGASGATTVASSSSLLGKPGGVEDWVPPGAGDCTVRPGLRAGSLCLVVGRVTGFGMVTEDPS